MPAKRAAARAAAPDHGLTKADACKVLQVAPSAEEDLVTKAYWHLASKLRVHASRDPEARRKLDELNRAYLVLSPAQTEAPLSHEVPPEVEETTFLDQLLSRLRALVHETAARWPGRAPELAVLTATTVWLGYLALAAGANPLWALLALAAALITIWSPWRRG